MLVSDLSTNEYSLYQTTYINAFDSNKTLLDGLKEGLSQLVNFVKNIPAEKLEYRYEEGKWTIKDILLHIIDTERIFTYRGLRISRGDKTPLPGFEQDDYVPLAFGNIRSIESLLEEYENVRKATISFFESLNEDQLLFLGTSSDNSISVRAIGYIITGHQNHHLKVISERYL
ncbi:DinB family protein [Flavobacterium hydrophilum]|uniref:Damage-inducible protein DinB n=1 Tax=Flavobacterium hydrophilum TaxID=2211445 RepID=A0A2V4C7J4_9FLAO|nr:DinB family protein [Flavobacterium hydrophilum]PXY46967.1 damage-inducible protein DinB [Flavobacterium hydrophilum]